MNSGKVKQKLVFHIHVTSLKKQKANNLPS